MKMTEKPITTKLDKVPFAFFYALVQWQQKHNSTEGKSYVHISAEYSDVEMYYNLEIKEYFDMNSFNGFLPKIYREIDKKID